MAADEDLPSWEEVVAAAGSGDVQAIQLIDKIYAGSAAFGGSSFRSLGSIISERRQFRDAVESIGFGGDSGFFDIGSIGDSGKSKVRAGENLPFKSQGGGILEHEVKRGYIVPYRFEDEIINKITFRFMYNPTEISMEYASGNPPTTSGEGGAKIFRESATVTWSIFLDRMIEKKLGILDNGVLHDIEVWEALLGIDETGNIQPVPLKVVFGPNLFFVGDITSATLDMTVFASDMIPTRAEISFGLRVTFIGETEDPSTEVQTSGGRNGPRGRRDVSDIDTDISGVVGSPQYDKFVQQLNEKAAELREYG